MAKQPSDITQAQAASDVQIQRPAPAGFQSPGIRTPEGVILPPENAPLTLGAPPSAPVPQALATATASEIIRNGTEVSRKDVVRIAKRMSVAALERAWFWLHSGHPAASLAAMKIILEYGNGRPGEIPDQLIEGADQLTTTERIARLRQVRQYETRDIPQSNAPLFNPVTPPLPPVEPPTTP